MAHGDQLGPALEPGVVLFQDLEEQTGVSWSSRQAPPPSLLSGLWETLHDGNFAATPRYLTEHYTTLTATKKIMLKDYTMPSKDNTYPTYCFKVNDTVK